MPTIDGPPGPSAIVDGSPPTPSVRVHSAAELTEAVHDFRNSGQDVGLVAATDPLHRGHQMLVERCEASGAACAICVRPRSEKDPGWFTTLVSLVRPDLVVVSRKHLREAVALRTLAASLHPGITVDVAPIVREPDGVAVGSGIDRLSPSERADAVGLVRGLECARRAYRAGERSRGALEEAVRVEVGLHRRLTLESVSVVRLADLYASDPVESGSAVVGIVRCGGVRLSDNLLLSEAR